MDPNIQTDLGPKIDYIFEKDGDSNKNEGKPLNLCTCCRISFSSFHSSLAIQCTLVDLRMERTSLWVQNSSSMAENDEYALDILSDDFECLALGPRNIFDSSSSEDMSVDSGSPEKSAPVASLLTPNYTARTRGRNTAITPKRFQMHKPRKQSSPKKIPLPVRRLEF